MHRMMIAGEQADIDSFKIWLKINLQPGVEARKLENDLVKMCSSSISRGHKVSWIAPKQHQ